ncbi:MAG: O-antigen ligase family protein [Candidatus Omnitrophota bacterium]
MIAVIKSIAVPVLYAAGIFVFFFSLTGKVRLGLLFLVPLLPLQNVLMRLQYYPFGKDINDIILIGMVLGWFIYANSNNQKLLDKTPYNKILFFYMIFTYIALWRGSYYIGYPAPLNAMDPRLQNWKNYMILPLLFILTLNNIEDKLQMKKLFIVMCVSMLIMNYYTVRQISWMTSWVSRVKISGTFMWLGANEVAAFYATYTFVLIGVLFLIKNKKMKLFLTLLIALNLYCNLFLFSRGAYLATLAGFLFLAIARSRKLIIPIALILIFWQAVLPKEVVERVKETKQEEGRLDESAQTRIILWQQSIEYFKQNPVIGVGFNVFSHLGLKRDAHNVYLRTLAEEGLVGLSFLLLIMAIAIRRGWRLYKNSGDVFFKGLGLGFCACVIAVMAGNFFGDRWSYLPLGAYFWVYLGMVERGNLLQDQRLKTIDQRP